MGTNNLKDFIHKSELNRKADWDSHSNWKAIETKISNKGKIYFSKIFPLLLLGLFLITASFLIGYYWGKSINTSDNINLYNPIENTLPAQRDTVQVFVKDSIYIVEKIKLFQKDTIYLLANPNITLDKFEDLQPDTLQKNTASVVQNLDISAKIQPSELANSKKNSTQSYKLNKRTNKSYAPYIFIEDTLDRSKLFQKIEWSKNNRFYFTNIQRQ